MSVDVLRLALDENFPSSLLHSLTEWLPDEIRLVPLNEIDRRLNGLSDRELIIALRQLDFSGLVTNNWRMLNIPSEITAIIATKSIVVAMKKMGDDPIRAAGALLLELPGLRSRIRPDHSNVFLLHYARRPAQDAWDFLQQAAEREDTTAPELWQLLRPSEQELTSWPSSIE